MINESDGRHLITIMINMFSIISTKGKSIITLPVLLFFFFGVQAQEGKPFYVGLNSGETVYGNKLEFIDKLIGKDYLLLDDSMKYLLSDIKFYQRESGYYLKKNISMRGDVWFKRNIEGKINTYSATEWSYSPGMMGPNGMYTGGYSRAIKMSYYEKGYQFKEMNYENLKRDLKNHEASMLQLEKVRKMKNTNIGIYVGSAALILAGIAHTAALNKQEGPPPYDADIKFSPFLIVGAIGIAIPSFINMSKEEKLLQAIKTYNKDN